MRLRSMLLWLVILVSLVFPSQAAADIGILNGLTHEKNVSVGETYETLIVIKNFGDKEKIFKAYLVDYHFYSDGRQVYSSPGQLLRSNAKWITFYPSRHLLPPGETAEIKCVVKVPAFETLTGTYWSLLMVEPVEESTAIVAATKDGQARVGIKQVLRYGIQIITNIGDSGMRDIKFLDMKIIQEAEKKILQVDVENIGERWLRPVLYVELYDEQGRAAGKYEAGKWRIFPGTSVRYEVEFAPIQKGRYKAMVIVDNLDDYVFGAEYQLVLNP